MKIFLQVHIIEITVHQLPIMTIWLFGYSKRPLYLCYRDLCAVKFHTPSIQTPSLKIQSSISRPLQYWCYPGIAVAIGDKGLE